MISDRYIEFTKMHGAGNDYVYIDCLQGESPTRLSELANRIADRHFGIGGDGLVVILPSDKAEFRMRMFNSDGSEAQMCGNASRCVAKYLYDKKYISGTDITLETLSGIKLLHLHINNNRKVEKVTVDMGYPVLDAVSIPVISKAANSEFPVKVSLANEINAYAVSMGNPHGVIFTDNLTDAMVLGRGPLFEKDPVWPEKANIEFVKVLDKHNVKMRVWERGTGETLACGTGACAAVVAGILTDRLLSPVNVVLPGGVLSIEWNGVNDTVKMTGPAVTVASGRYYIPENIYFSPPLH